MNRPVCRALVMKHEGGFRAFKYSDSKGIWTIGVGLNLEDIETLALLRVHSIELQDLMNGKALAYTDGMAIFDDQLMSCEYRGIARFGEQWAKMPDAAQHVLVDMIFNMGWPRFSEFVHMMACLDRGDYLGAVEHMKASLWYEEVGSRAVEDCELMASCASKITPLESA